MATGNYFVEEPENQTTGKGSIPGEAAATNSATYPPIANQPAMNEGIPMTAIIKDLESRKSDEGYPLSGYLPRLE